MKQTTCRAQVRAAWTTAGLAGAILLAPAAGTAQAAPTIKAAPVPHYSSAVAFDVSLPAGTLAVGKALRIAPDTAAEPIDIRPEPGIDVNDTGFTGDGALQGGSALRALTVQSAAIPGTLANFEGISNQDNFDLFGFRVNPPDPVGAVGPNHYVQMVNLAYAVYDKSGNLLLGPADTGSLWAGFAVPDCTDPSGDPIVVYDRHADRWILSQFTTRFTADPQNDVFYNCVAISVSGDPTGAYYRYAFTTGNYFPDYPKYGVWRDSYVITTREIGPTIEYGIGVYGLERTKMLQGKPDARVVSYFIDGNDPDLLPLIGDGLLPADLDGKTKPKNNVPIPLVGTQDDGGGYGATSDALNIWEFDVHWNSKPDSSLVFAAQLPVAPFDSIFPCAPTSRDCLPQPGIANPAQYLDILSYRQRPTWRLAYRSFKDYEALVTNQSVEAAPGVAGIRWYEIRRADGVYTLHQQGPYAPGDGVHRWIGSVAMDQDGNMALGYSVVNGVDVYPGIRYTGRMSGDPLGQMTLGEGTIIAGTGVQTTTNSRWGDYTSMNVDPADDCTFWYTNEYYTAAGQASSAAGWQTRIASFMLPGCSKKK
jgi:hypothetical protein